jgi:DNA-binding Xre family transcriptional regulator
MFKSKLKALKIGKGVSWAEISRVTGISAGSLSRLAANRGAWTTNTRHLDSLCRYFRCGLDDLLEFEPRLGMEASVHIDDLYPSGRRRAARPNPAQAGPANGQPQQPAGPARRRRRTTS